MAKSRETFNKKEKEKKRLKKKQEKEEKKEARKASSSRGGDLDDMIAYVDADGNITSTPPDPSEKRKKIELEDIEVSVSKQAPVDPEDLRRKGKVTFFNTSKGYGFIKDLETQESIFVHVKGLIDDIQENDQVTFETEKTPKGLSAVDVKLVEK
ncbi:cold-shock protein [Negadavirga shengliensis]|uniref:Cold-shock protein n=1 Tax=Negadavirga shengliensis TaxID=1389218 RepID=A0ABV9SZI3_9BACT